MAPVKRTTVAQRETRATRAAAVAKKQATATEKKASAVSVAKPDPATKSTTATRRSKAVVKEEQHGQDTNAEQSNTTEPEKSVKTRNTRAAPLATGLGAAPRRRIKVTPLDAPTTNTNVSEDKTVSSKTPKAQTSDEKRPKKKATRAKALGLEVNDGPTDDGAAQVAKTKSVGKSAPESVEPPKARGRPKSDKVADSVSKTIESEHKPTTRTTRSKRATSTATTEDAATQLEPREPQPSGGVRKKVTFQDLPDVNEKENQPLPQSKAKKNATVASGLRAKPLRKTAAASAASRTRSAGVSAAEPSDKAAGLVTAKKDKKISRVLTPKKITQVAKSSSPEQQEQCMLEDEDELNGGKTPIRDLSVSPRRPTTSAIARVLSPVKKLDFNQDLVANSPDKQTSLYRSEHEQTGSLASPARRPAASPFKDALKGSPKRSQIEGAKILFPNRNEYTASIALPSLASAPAGQAMTNILQSPRRPGPLDPNFFSQSAMKTSVAKSPLKSSLFGSPAKRLFSPAKKSSTSASSLSRQVEAPERSADTTNELELASEVSASSHFRSSLSPLRVVRVNSSAVEFDFDDSIMQIRSPLKVNQSPGNEKISTDMHEDSLCVESDMSLDVNDADKAQVIEDATTSEAVDSTLDDLKSNADGLAASYQSLQPDQQKKKTDQSRPAPRHSLSQVLFRSNKAVIEESSEDELAGDDSPVNQSAGRLLGTAAAPNRSRLSTGVKSCAAATDYGFTPLAVQMSGWLASSPDKSPERTHSLQSGHGGLDFSPLARQHVDGEVMISRNSTPAQNLDKRTSLHFLSAKKASSTKRKSSNLRKSLGQRQSLGQSLMLESPARNSQFEEYMEMRALEEDANAADPHEPADIDASDDDFYNDQYAEDEEVGDTILEDHVSDNEDQEVQQAGELTTDLVNFTHASDTAIVDFRKLAEEADGLAAGDIENDIDEATVTRTDVSQDPEDMISNSDAIYNTGNKIDEIAEPTGIESPKATNDSAFSEEICYDLQSPTLRPVDRQLDSPSILVIDHPTSPATSVCSVVHASATSPLASLSLTPQPNLRLNERRVINTVVSKVPLKPEGGISPIKMAKKRSRSFGNSDASPAKRISLGSLQPLPVVSVDDVFESPNRRVRTSVAPSPGGTSTPATAKSNHTRASRYSLGAVSTPGQMSFAIDDFGDSTLDGIEVPEDFDDETRFIDECTSSKTTPRATLPTTPNTARRSVRRVTAPVSTTKNTRTAQKTVDRTPKPENVQRTPLKPVGKGVLHGAVIFVDVHTSEGTDASGIFVELLTQMGAKCVKEWRWNSRASTASAPDTESAEQKIGISHVVYKDGGKRTLEKVRSTKGDVCCVGVAWVLDCERENKWLDESSYAVDTNIIPRGGSNRRKSMEPRALLVGNDGSVSVGRPRRSVSAEMNQVLKRELVNTPARNQNTSDNDDDDEESDGDLEQSTPTGFVSYDPRTAMTPGTPYLVSKGKSLTQMSAPPKQQNKSIFEDEDEENDDTFLGGGNDDSGAVKDAKKFRMRNLGDIAKRRRTLGWKPDVRSPLGKN